MIRWEKPRCVEQSFCKNEFFIFTVIVIPIRCQRRRQSLLSDINLVLLKEYFNYIIGLLLIRT